MGLTSKLQSISARHLSAVIALVYALVATVSLQFSFQGTNASPVWPPSGLAFVAMWFLGYRIWPGIAAGALMANLIAFTAHDWPIGHAFIASVFIGFGDSLEAVVGVFLLRRMVPAGRKVLSTVKDIFQFVLSAVAAGVLAATMGTCMLWMHPSAGVSMDIIWFTWWLGDVIGILVIGSLCLTFHKDLWQISWKNGLEAFMVSLVLVIVNGGVFMGRFPEYGFYSHVTYLVLPFAIWATYRFGFPGASVSVLITAVIAVTGSIDHLGPFVGQWLPVDLVIVECFMGVVSVTVLTLAAALYERQRAEESLKQNEARFRSLVENSFEVVAMVDLQARVVYTSPPTKNLLGYETQDMIGHSMFEWMHPEDIPEVMGKFQDLIKTPGAVAHVSFRMQRKNGTWRWMEGSGCNVLHQPSIRAVVINYRDITERKEFEEIQEHFVSIVENSDEAIVSKTLEGVITSWNKGAEGVYGFTAQEMIGCPIDTVVPEDKKDELAAMFRALEKGEKVKPMETTRRRKDGTLIDVLVTLSPLRNNAGTLYGVASIARDITERKKAQKAVEMAEKVLRRDKETLLRLVDERSKELIKTQKELRHFSRLADIGTLAATVAHELRNPLGVIHLAAYNLKRDKELSANRHLLNIEKKVWEGNQIIDNLLTYARIKIPNYEPVKVISILDECVAATQGRFCEKGIVIEKSYSEGLKLIEADPNQIREIFLNILNNACQSFSHPGGRVQLRAWLEGETVKVTVQDWGSGIAEEDLPKVFEPFFTRKSKGTGLGLTICSELVNLHQGKIDIESRQGQGTTVMVILPAFRRNHEQAAVG